MEKEPFVPPEDLTSRELEREYSLYIHVIRHAPKDKSGDLSPEGKKRANKYFSTAYASKPLYSYHQPAQEIYLSAPKKRVTDTVKEYRQAQRDTNGKEVPTEEVDSRLGEEGIDEFLNHFGYNSDNWEEFRGWFRKWNEVDKIPETNIPTAKDAVAGFCQLLVEKIEVAQKSGGVIELNAFSQGAVMASFILTIEKKLGIKFLADIDDEGRDKLDLERLFFKENAPFGYLSSFNIIASSSDKKNVEIIFQGKSVLVPLETIENLASTDDILDSE